MASCIQRNDKALQNRMEKNVDDAPVMPSSVAEKKLDARSMIEEMECERVRLFSEQPTGLVAESSKEIERMILQAKLDRMTEDLQDVRLLNGQFKEEQALQLSCQQKAELIREQVEMETARTILQLQEEVAALQCKLDEKLCSMTRENTELRKIIATKEEEIKAINMEWERATLELTGFLVDGSRSLKKASSQIESIARSFPQANAWISERVEGAAKIYIEKEETILQLKRSLEDAQNTVVDLGQKLSSLKGVTLALTELQHLDNDEISNEHVNVLLNEKIDLVKFLEKKLKFKEAEVIEAEKCANVAFVVMNWLFDSQKVVHKNELGSTIPISTPVKMANHKVSEATADANALALEDAMTCIELARSGVFESENDIKSFYADTEMYITALQTHIQEVSSAYKEMVQNLVKEVRELREKYIGQRAECKNFNHCTVDMQLLQVHKYQKFEDQFLMFHEIRDELNKMNCRLRFIEDSIHAEVNVFECSSTDGVLIFSSSSSDFSNESSAVGNKLDASSIICRSNSREKLSEQLVDLEFEGSTFGSGHQKNQKMRFEDLCNSEAARNLLKKELGMLFNDFNKLHVQLAALSNELNLGHFPEPEGTYFLELAL